MHVRKGFNMSFPVLNSYEISILRRKYLERFLGKYAFVSENYTLVQFVNSKTDYPAFEEL